MGLKSSFSQNVMKVDGKKVHLSKNTYLLSDVSSSFPKWIQEHDSFNKKDFGVVIFVKKGEQAELQIDYSKLSSPFKKFIFLEEDSSLFYLKILSHLILMLKRISLFQTGQNFINFYAILIKNPPLKRNVFYRKNLGFSPLILI